MVNEKKVWKKINTLFQIHNALEAELNKFKQTTQSEKGWRYKEEVHGRIARITRLGDKIHNRRGQLFDEIPPLTTVPR